MNLDRGGRSSGGIAVLVLVMVGLAVFTSKPFLRLVFPISYREEVQVAADHYELDPWLVYAMLRVESHFNPQATSAKGAVGLMQLMPDTAKWIAEQRGLERFKVADLYLPGTNVEFGCWYLRSLLNRFNGDETVALAAYNGGLARVQEWLEKKKWTGERETLNQIPFPETRRYVRQVLSVREWYAWLYGNGAQPVLLR